MLDASPRPDLRTMLLGAFIASLGAGAVAGVVAILTADTLDGTTAHVVLTIAALTLYGLAALAANSLVGRRPGLAPLGLLGLAISAIGLVTALSAIWVDHPGPAGLAQAAVALLIATLAIAFVALRLRTSDAGDAAEVER